MNKTPIICVFLGNDSKELSNTRHNIGWLFCDFMALITENTFIEKKHYYYFKDYICTGISPVYFIKLKTLMNDSGKILRKICQKQKWNYDQLIIFADNTDLKLTKFKIKNHICNNGHRGTHDIVEQFKTNKIKMFYLGIDRQKNLKQWVLSQFEDKEILFLNKYIFPKLWNKFEESLKLNMI